MKSYLPIFILVGVVLAVALGGFIFFNSQAKKTTDTKEEETVVAKELPLEERPYATLTPDSDGKELTLSVTRIPSGVAMVEYELRYSRYEKENNGDVPDGVTGSAKVDGPIISKKLTLGTCSSGVCRYHQQVKDIALTVRLRDSKGKAVAQKMTTEVTMGSSVKTVKSADGALSLAFDKVPAGTWIIMNTLGLPAKTSPGTVASGPYGVFSSSSAKTSATVTLDKGTVKMWDGSKWSDVSGKASVPGVFVGVGQ